MNRKECLETALDIVSKDRQNDYGTPESNFGTIAAYWNTYLHSTGALEVTGWISPHDVAAMMCLLKIARIATSPTKDDNWIDLAGYAANGAEVVIDPYKPVMPPPGTLVEVDEEDDEE